MHSKSKMLVSFSHGSCVYVCISINFYKFTIQYTVFWIYTSSNCLRCVCGEQIQVYVETYQVSESFRPHDSECVIVFMCVCILWQINKLNYIEQMI